MKTFLCEVNISQEIKAKNKKEAKKMFDEYIDICNLDNDIIDSNMSITKINK